MYYCQFGNFLPCQLSIIVMLVGCGWNIEYNCVVVTTQPLNWANKTLKNIQAHSFFKGFSTGLVPLTRGAIVPYLVAVSLQGRMCNTVIFDIY